MGILAKNCGIKGGYDELRKIIKGQDGRDTYMDADAALSFGIVDAIGMPKVHRMKLYQVENTPKKVKTLEKTPVKKSDSKRFRK